MQLGEELCSDTLQLAVQHNLDPRVHGSFRLETLGTPFGEIRLGILHEPERRTLTVGLADDVAYQGLAGTLPE